MLEFRRYKLSSGCLSIGERRKIGLFCPSARVLRYSTITGALRDIFGREVYAFGKKIEGEAGILTYGPRERVAGMSRLPLQIEFLTNVSCEVFVDKESAEEIEEELKERREFWLYMGSLRSKGFGRCNLRKGEELSSKELSCSIIYLETRLPLSTTRYRATKNEISKMLEEGEPTKFLKEVFGIKRVIKPNLGYLFEPDEKRHSGNYVLSLFEESLIEGPRFLGKEERDGKANR
jgi:hypothetical protein